MQCSCNSTIHYCIYLYSSIYSFSYSDTLIFDFCSHTKRRSREIVFTWHFTTRYIYQNEVLENVFVTVLVRCTNYIRTHAESDKLQFIRCRILCTPPRHEIPTGNLLTSSLWNQLERMPNKVRIGHELFIGELLEVERNLWVCWPWSVSYSFTDPRSYIWRCSWLGSFQHKR